MRAVVGCRPASRRDSVEVGFDRFRAARAGEQNEAAREWSRDGVVVGRLRDLRGLALACQRA